jgi:phage terminase large subunit-like protein
MLASPNLIIHPDEYALAESVVKFITDYCRAPDGKNVGQPIRLRPWQITFLGKLYRTRKGKRIIRRAILSMARKNGKSALTGCLLLVHLCGPCALRNAQIYSAAKTRDQAGIVYKLAAGMIRLHPRLMSRTKIKDYTKEIFHPASGSSYEALGADFIVAHGLSPAFAVHDELGQSGAINPLYDAIESGMGAHESPLSVIISTQAATNDALLSVIIDDALTNEDESTLIELHTAPEGCDLMDEEAWALANPALGDFRSLDDVREQAKRAVRVPSYAPVFRNLTLNQRVSTQKVFLPREIWDLNSEKPDMEYCAGRPAWLGLDLSARTDLCALVVNVPYDDGRHAVIPYFWLPEEGLAERQQKDKVPYQAWVDQGFLTLCPGASIDLRWVVERLGEVHKLFDIKCLAFDRWRIEFFKTLIDDREMEFPMEPFGQGFKDMSPALDQVEALAVDGKILHGAHPILRWNFANARVLMDPAGGRKLDKAKSLSRIDGAVATCMAIGAQLRPIEDEEMKDIPLGFVGR